MSGTGSNIPNDPTRGASVTARRASVTLRAQQEGADADALMDPANRSLADALRITYRIVQLLMLALAGLYLFSGFQTIKETEQGIRVLFGKEEAVGLEPGFRFSYPAPLGELIKIDTGNQTLDLYDDFWFFVSADQKDTKLADLSPTASLNPERDGSLLTADNNIAHAKVQVIYRRDPNQIGVYAQNTIPDDARKTEQSIVRGAVRRAMVQSIAGINIDELLRQGSGEAGSVAAQSKELAQAILDRSKTGLRIEQLKLEEKMPPLYLREAFTKVQSAAAAAASAVEKANTDRKAALNAVAGEAAPVVIRMIDRLELDIAKKDEAAQKQTMAAIVDVLEGRETKFDGMPVRAALVTGEVTSLLDEARQYRNTIVQMRQADAKVFLTKLEAFHVSPAFTVYREWADSMNAFMERESVQTLLAPRGTHTLQLTINADPNILKDMERKAKLKEGDDAALKRAQEQRNAQFKVDTGLKVRAN